MIYNADMSIRVRSMLIIASTSLLIIAAAITAGLGFTQAHLIRTIERDMNTIADTADRLISSEISLLKANVAVAAWHLTGAGGNFHQILEEQYALYDGFLALTLVDGGTTETGPVILDFAGNPPVHPDFFDSVYARRAFSGESILSTSIVDPVSGNLVFYVCVPIGGGRLLIATIDGMYFSNILSGLAIWDTGHVFIDDAEGYILANPRTEWVRNRYNFINMAQSDPRFRSIAAVVSRMIQGQRGNGRFLIDGAERFCAYRPITGSLAGWSLGVIAPLNEGPSRNVRGGILLVGLISILLSIGAAIVASGILEKPYQTIRGMMAAMEHQETLLHTTNQIAEILLRTDSSRFEQDLRCCMGMMARSVNADRMRIFQNRSEGGEVACTLIHEWLRDAPPSQELSKIYFSYNRDAPNWYQQFIKHQCVNSLVRELPDLERDMLVPLDIRSILCVPLFFHEEFWGFISFDDCRNERVFSIDEEGLMSSGAILMVNALERNDMEKDLIRAHEEAVASTEAKSRFLANMSHEMRTPLNAIIGLTELILGSAMLHNEDEENLGKIYNSGMILLGIINDLLDLSKIESGKFEIIPVEYDMPSLINDTVTLNSVRIGSKPITFNLHLDAHIPGFLRGDDLRIKQMLNNLLSNAFKYTKQGRVDWTISCRRDGDSVWFTSVIKDTGVGIRPDDLQKLFSDYNQVDTRSNRNIEGTGLGLSITRRMAEMMDGGITVESEYGAGTTFTLTVRQGFVSDVPIGAEVAENLQSFRYIDHKRDRSAKLVRASIPYARVLVVDDMPINLDVARGLLKPYQLQVDCVSSGVDAVSLIRKEQPRYDAIFMDHMMPEMDGIEATRIIRGEIGSGYAKTIPIIALTANAIAGNEEMFLSSGFQAFLSKPIDIRALDVAINRWVRNREKEKELAAPGTPKRESAGMADGKADDGMAGGLAEDWDIAAIDIKKALANFAGDEDSLRHIFVSYVSNTPPLLEKIRRCAKDGLNDYAIIVHGIKSASRSIGAEALGLRAEALEKAAKGGDFETVSADNAGFIAEAEQLIARLSSLLAQTGETSPRPLMDRPDAAALAALRDSAATGDIDGVDAAMERLESCRYESGGDLVSWLRGQINVMAFDAIAARLERELSA
jgi:signal transduction histidine kinase/CheY-like chemotaxis protein